MVAQGCHAIFQRFRAISHTFCFYFHVKLQISFPVFHFQISFPIFHFQISFLVFNFSICVFHFSFFVFQFSLFISRFSNLVFHFSFFKSRFSFLVFQFSFSVSSWHISVCRETRCEKRETGYEMWKARNEKRDVKSEKRETRFMAHDCQPTWLEPSVAIPRDTTTSRWFTQKLFIIEALHKRRT